MNNSYPKRQNVSVLGLGVALSLGATVVNAQQLEEIIVTAQKRTESLQDVPISVSAIQGEKIDNAGIPDMSALSDYVPNLFISDAPVNTNIYMRGTGSGNNQAFEQSVGMYIDGIYMGRGRQYRSPFLDIERVEVLRGPQGTLFGKNTVAGAVSIITASPNTDDEFNGEVAISAEENGGLVGDLVLSGAVSDTFALRLAARYKETDGFAENTYLNTDEAELEENVFRLTAVWLPADTIDVNFKYSRNDWQREGATSSTWLYLDPEARNELVPNRGAVTNIAYLLVDTFYPELATVSAKDFTIYMDNGYGQSADDGIGIGINPVGSDTTVDNLAVNTNFAIGEHTLTSVTGWSSYNYVDGDDPDYLPLQFIARDDDQGFEQFSQEFRITSPGGEFFEYVGGVYYEQSDLEFDRRVTVDLNMDGLVPQVLGVESLLTLLTGGAYAPNQISRNHYYQLDSSSWAAFFQGTFNLSDTLSLTLGLRYTEEDKDVVSRQFLADSIAGHTVPSNNFLLGSVFASTFDTYTYDYAADRSTDAWIPSLNLQWDVTDNSMLYFTASEGFKSGGFTAADDGAPDNLIAQTWLCAQNPDGSVTVEDCYNPNNPSDDFEFDDEEVTAFEIGGKHTLLDGGMTLNWAAFHTEYTNLQTSIFKGVSFGVANAAESSIQGVEIDWLWQATERFRLGANAAWLDAEFDQYVDAPCTAIQLDAEILCGQPGGVSNNDLSGKSTTFAPQYTASAYFNYEHTIANGMGWFLAGEANFRDEYHTQGDLDPVDLADSYTKMNLRGGLRSADGSWELMIYGRNLTDEQATGISLDVPLLSGSHTWLFDEGRVYGARLRYQW